jgi:hypothetical protein
MGVLRHGGDVYDGEHEPVVSRAEFEKVQQMLSSRTTPRPKRHAFTYRGLLVCGHCGRGVTAEEHRKRSGLRFVYYRCTRRVTEPGVCPRPFLSERTLESAITSVVGLLDVNERCKAWALAWVDQQAREARAVNAAARHAIEKQLKDRDAELERLTTLVVRGIVADAEYVSRKTNLQAERSELEARLADPSLGQSAAVERLRETLALAADAPRRFRDASSSRSYANVSSFAKTACAFDWLPRSPSSRGHQNALPSRKERTGLRRASQGRKRWPERVDR